MRRILSATAGLTLSMLAGCGKTAAPAMPAVRPFGVNMNQLLLFYLGFTSGTAADARRQLQDAAAMGATYARLTATPYWPNQMTGPKGWVNHPDVYFAGFDAMIADARAAGVHLL